MNIDPSIGEKMEAAGATPSSDEPKKINGMEITDLPTDWTDFYTLQKQYGEDVPTDPDSIAFMKRIEIKYDVADEEMNGFAMRIEKATEEELERFSNTFQDMNPGNDANKDKSKSIDNLDVKWDGKKLIIPMDNPLDDPDDASPPPDMSMVKSMFGDANIIMVFRFKFDDKIKRIDGKHDLLTKIDDYTMEYKIDMLQIMEMESKGEKLANSDAEIVVHIK